MDKGRVAAFQPIRIEAGASSFGCARKRTDSRPFCDGSRRNLPRPGERTRIRGKGFKATSPIAGDSGPNTC
jgi:hypothetical protein